MSFTRPRRLAAVVTGSALLAALLAPASQADDDDLDGLGVLTASSDSFENGTPLDSFTRGVEYVEGIDAELSHVVVADDDPLARPGQEAQEGVLRAETDAGGGGLQRVFTEPFDLSGDEGIGFWYHGTGSGDEVTFRLQDDRAPDPGPEGWEVVWADEFDGAQGTPPDPNKWGYAIGDGSSLGLTGWGNQERQYYTDDPANASHDGEGNLVIRALESEGGYSCYYGTCEYTSARLLTQYKHEFKFGRIEIRAKVPVGNGLWPAFWALGANYPDVGWPRSGEIDILEHVGRLPNTVNGHIHGPQASGSSSHSFGSTHTISEPIAADFREVAIEWTPGYIGWDFDGVRFHEARPNNVPVWVYDNPFYLLLNVAVGGNFGGPVNATFPQELVVDYVRVYGPPDTAERYETTFTDDVDGWQLVQIPFSQLARSADQPDGAPDNGLSLDEVWGYELHTSEGTTFHLDEVRALEEIDVPPPEGDLSILAVHARDNRVIDIQFDRPLSTQIQEYVEGRPNYLRSFIRIDGAGAFDGRLLSQISSTSSVRSVDVVASDRLRVLLGSTGGAPTLTNADYELWFDGGDFALGDDLLIRGADGTGLQGTQTDPVSFQGTSAASQTASVDSAVAESSRVVRVTFGQTILSGMPAGAYTANGIRLVGPGGTINPTYVQAVAGSDRTQWLLFFGQDLEAATYELQIAGSNHNLATPAGSIGGSATLTAPVEGDATPFGPPRIISATTDEHRNELVLTFDRKLASVEGAEETVGITETPLGTSGVVLTDDDVRTILDLDVQLQGGGDAADRLADIAAHFPDRQTLVVRLTGGAHFAPGTTGSVALNEGAALDVTGQLSESDPPLTFSVPDGPVPQPDTGYDPDAEDYLIIDEDATVGFLRNDFTFTNPPNDLSVRPANVSDRVITEEIPAIVVENKYIEATFVPEYGGRLLSLIYKPTGNDLLYTNPVGVPYGFTSTPVGQRGNSPFYHNWLMVWGGVFPTVTEAEHGKYWFLPWDYEITETDDEIAISMSIVDDLHYADRPGAYNYGATLIETEVVYRVSKDNPVVDMDVSVHNPTAQNRQFEYWVAATFGPGEESTHGSPTMEVISNVERVQHIGWSPWMADVEQPAAGQRMLYLDKLNRITNWTSNGIAYGMDLATRPQNDWWGVVNHENSEGVIRVSDNSITYGMKFWMWGHNASFDTNIHSTSSARPYIELWGGTSQEFFAPDNLAAGATKSWSESYLPTMDLSDVTNANEHGAGHVRFKGLGSALTVEGQVFATAIDQSLRATLVDVDSDTELADLDFTASPYHKATLDAPASQGATIKLVLEDADGEVLLEAVSTHEPDGVIDPPPGELVCGVEEVVFSSNFDEGNVDGWQSAAGSEQVSASTAQAFSGTHSLLTSGRSTFYMGPMRNLIDFVTPGETYELSAQLRRTAGASGAYYFVGITSTGGAQTFTVLGDPVTVTSDGWVELTATWEVPPGVTFAAIKVEGTAGQNIYLDDFSATHSAPGEPVESPSDDFDGDELDGCRWDRVVRYDPDLLELADGQLLLETSPGDIYQGNESEPANLIMQTQPDGDWTIETKLTEDLGTGYSQAGLLAYLNDDNYVKLNVIADVDQSGVNRIELRSEVDGEIVGPQPNLPAPSNDGEWWLRLSKQGDVFTGSVSVDGETWTSFPQEVTNELAAAHGAVGLFAFAPNEVLSTVAFDYFHVLDEVEPPAELELELAASTRCVAGNVYVTVTARNDNEVPVDIEFVSELGSRTFIGVAPDRFASQASNTRSASVDAGSVTVRGSAVVDGVEVSVEQTVDFGALSCG